MTHLLRPPQPADVPALLKLNNDHAVELSELTPDEFRVLLGIAWRVRVADDAAAMVIALDQDSDSDGQNFSWFRRRYDRFVYVDRVVVSPAARGKGLARTLYDDVITAAGAEGHTLLCAEVNLEPPNPASDAFHAAMGFAEVGRSELDGHEKSVRYFVRELGADTP
ncbi:GNAT family N-acetyltransferase [Haloactinopolyspora alba]|uniref:GNAT family N-acetyltransferase n=1 Tax=Haloactinopolyspora alba TaxID=648780 RepID=UPI000D0D42F3|nr:GNAT family N-acetyltransferase [Haloactinopolyspora alba]